MSIRTNVEFLSDIQESVYRISVYIADMTFELFQVDTKTQDAVIRNLEVIGEATKNLPMEFRAEYTNVPWKNMAGVRDRLIHHYFGVDLEIVWNIITTELPDVATQIEIILNNEAVSDQT